MPVKYTEIDEQLILDDAKQSDVYAVEFMMRRYMGLVVNKSKSYFLIGADKDDVIQEGMIGLYKAIMDYDKKKLASFRGFADLCITRQIITAIKSATRKKHIPLNSYVSLNKPIEGDRSDLSFQDLILSSESLNPELVLMSKEFAEDLNKITEEVLSGFERAVFRRHISGEGYREISAFMNKSEKSIDNAIQRVKRKLSEHIDFR